MLRVTSRAGAVVIAAEDRGDVRVEGGAEAMRTTDEGLTVDGGRGRVAVRCPTGTDLLIGAGSGSVSVTGAVGAARVTSARGSVTIEHAREVDARTGSGAVTIGTCEGACRVKSGRGMVRVGRAASAELSAERGRVEVDAVGPAKVRVGRGSISVGLTEPATAELETHAGAITVTVPHGVRPALALHSRRGQVRCDFSPGRDGEIRATTANGQIVVAER